MSDNGNDNSNGNGKKNGKKGINWSGMAAFITAVAGVIAMFVVQDKKGSENDMVQESTYVILNARMDRMEDRLTHIERMFMASASAHDYMMDTVKKNECNTDEDCDEYSACEDGMCVPEPTPGDDGGGISEGPERPKPEPSRKETARDKIIEKYSDFKDIKEHVQAEQAPVRF